MNIKEVHRELIAALKKVGRDPGMFPIASYLGTIHRVYNVPVPVLQRLAKNWANTNSTISQEDLTSFVDVLFHGESREEKKMASLLLGAFPHFLWDVPSPSLGAEN